MVETGTFKHGIAIGDTIFLSFILEEEVFKHTLQALNDPACAGDVDETFLSAAILAKRLTLAGADPEKQAITPDMILNLSREDGALLLNTSARLQQRREEFRKAAEGSKEDAGGAPETRGGLGSGTADAGRGGEGADPDA